MGNEARLKLKPLLANTVGRWTAGSAAERSVLLCYHSVDPSVPFSTSPALFESHLYWLAQNCEIVGPDDCLTASYTLNRPRVVITFDDGYLDNYHIALPLLLKYNLRATFFITTGLIDLVPEALTQFASGWQVPKHLISPMSWAQIRELSSEGMPVGAHTHLHPVLSRLTQAAAVADMRHSKQRLEEQLKLPVTLMSYPYGRPGSAVTAATLKAAAIAGFQKAGVVLSRGARPTDDPLAIPRFIADGDSTETLREKVLGWWDWIGRSRELFLRM